MKADISLNGCGSEGRASTTGLNEYAPPIFIVLREEQLAL